MPFTEGAKKRKPKPAPNNPERFSTMPAGKRRHRDEEKRMKQGKVVKKPSEDLKRKSNGGLGRISDALR